MTDAESAFLEWECQYVGGGDGVLNRKVDPDTSNRRHGVRRIADANESGTIPAAQTIYFDLKQFRVVPFAHLRHAVVQEGAFSTIRARSSSRPLTCISIADPLGTTIPHCQYSPRSSVTRALPRLA